MYGRLETERIRDAAMLLSQQRPYREFPMWWVADAMAARGLAIEASKNFTIYNTVPRLAKQWRWSAREAAAIPDRQIGDPVAQHVRDLEARAKALPGFAEGKGWPYGHDYCFVARRGTPDVLGAPRCDAKAA